jgi:prevent-host-death family protein
MNVYTIQEAKTHFAKLLKRVLNGEEVVIAKAGQPVARILPFKTDVSPRQPGADKGKVIVLPDFDAPLPEFEA